MAKARRLRLMLTGFFATIGVLMLFNFVINPLGAWRHRVVPGLYRRVRLERVITPYLLRTSAPQTLLLGSSRVFYGMKIEQGVKDGFENAAFSGSHLPEISKEVDVALRNPQLKRIIWGVEFYAFDSYGNACSPDTCARLDGDWGIKLTDSILSADALVASWRLVLRAASGNVTAQARMPIPWPAPYICDLFAHPPPPTLAGMDDAQRLREVSNLPEYRHFDYSPRAAEVLPGYRRAHPPRPRRANRLRPPGQRIRAGNDPADRALGGFSTMEARPGGAPLLHRLFRLQRDCAQRPDVHRRLAHGTRGRRRDNAASCWVCPAGDCRDATIVAKAALPVKADNVDQMLALQQQRLDAAVARPTFIRPRSPR